MSAAPTALIGSVLPRVFRVLARHDETADTHTFTLAPEDGAPVTFAAGQFNMLYLFGRGEAAISVSGNPTDRSKLVHTVRSVGSVTRGFDALAPGEAVGVRGPFGTAWPLEAARGRDVLVIAGGLGLAPLRPAILALLAHRAKYRKLVILYGTRNPSMLLFSGDLKHWAAARDLALAITVDHADAGWRGRVGLITRLIASAEFDPAHATALICGPEIMMHFSVEALKARGMADADIYLSLERNMKCALGRCGHCQLGPEFVCRDGPVFRHDRVAKLLAIPEL